MLYDEISASALPSILPPISFCEKTKSFVFTIDPKDPVLYSTIGESLNDSLNQSMKEVSDASLNSGKAGSLKDLYQYLDEIAELERQAFQRKPKTNPAATEKEREKEWKEWDEWMDAKSVAKVPSVYHAYVRGASDGYGQSVERERLDEIKAEMAEMERLNLEKYGTELYLNEDIKEKLAVLTKWMLCGVVFRLPAYRAFYYLLKSGGRDPIQMEDVSDGFSLLTFGPDE